MSTPTFDQLKRGLAIAEQIAALEAEMAALFKGSTSTAVSKATSKVKKTSGKGSFKRSPETIAKMKAAQQARWAKVKGKKSPTKAKAEPKKAETPAKGKRTISPAAKAKLAAAMKKRWADAQAGKAPAPNAGKKKQ